ncbi:RagB/SusD family nutrient uptake outer membrane protein [Zunongwangia sp. F363]|uniref:RagB/SusD family nutrient uptake outer membrane protein n=1 Tax=Autumnicola tepida TaxID=3075595 RepID=A0ABU3CBP7_9FLAO|nr:RagB/SusD family nutrient uptake outer membrane protein [Zunongwangia sp. F363]MDT0643632.1 RagB/SusD family nutrient uptake outer membrane protein [Zunongwangia sp. F363]
MKRYINKFYYVVLLVALAITGACSTDDLDPSLEQSKESENAILAVGDMEGLIKGAYNRMSAAGYYGRDYLVTNEVRTPNVFANGTSGRFTTEAAFAYLPNSVYMWDNAYSVIAIANILIGTDVSTLEGDQAYGEHIKGQAYAIRALAHYDLLLTYGQQYVGGDLGVPYVTEFKGGNDFPSRDSVDSNVENIMSDLETAFEMMNSDYFDTSKEFMSKYTAKALESRVALQFEMWEEARDAAKTVIDSGIYSIVPAEAYVSSFDDDGGTNSIFEIAQSTTDYPGSDRIDFIYRGSTYGDIEVIPEVMDLYDDGDVRADILGYEGEKLRNIGKYPNIGANIIVIRYEEVILNYAEALFQLGETAEALIWLNKIPEARNAELYSEVNVDNILMERRKEFVFEGLYYWDLLRYEMDVEKLSPLQNISETIPYGDYRLAFPIPLNEIDANSNITQNPGYGN